MRLCCKCSVKERHKTSAYCKPCLVEYSRKRYEDNKEELQARQRQYVQSNKEYVLRKNREWKAQNPELNNKLMDNWRKKNAAKVNAACKARRLAISNAVPKWVGPEELWMIEEAYSLSQLRSSLFGIKFHVDHIVPILGKNVCGLHSPDNLQVIPAIENYRKGNRVF